ncbi:hypothetical protein [Nitrosomonas sp. Nm34]|uniref:hypothetical protein n=1 Tax=Nitrosomonas sp. Nm34 TaxID=1881055 RepID=UPI0008DF666F|nr:hypothetical protein [Nitrosomonas sp. Nm34]SFI54619.1 hypothetical protein SAMN05428978_101612 [Nitrosomonas sp. Nm34]
MTASAGKHLGLINGLCTYIIRIHHLEADRIVQQVSRPPAVEKAVTIADFVSEEQEEKPLLLVDDIALAVGPFLLSDTASTASDHSLVQQRLALIE